jgi:hypothetical protein
MQRQCFLAAILAAAALQGINAAEPRGENPRGKATP